MRAFIEIETLIRRLRSENRNRIAYENAEAARTKLEIEAELARQGVGNKRSNYVGEVTLTLKNDSTT